MWFTDNVTLSHRPHRKFATPKKIYPPDSNLKTARESRTSASRNRPHRPPRAHFSLPPGHLDSERTLVKMKLNVSYPANGSQKLIEIDDDRKLRPFMEKRMGTEVRNNNPWISEKRGNGIRPSGLSAAFVLVLYSIWMEWPLPSRCYFRMAGKCRRNLFADSRLPRLPATPSVMNSRDMFSESLAVTISKVCFASYSFWRGMNRISISAC